MASNQYPTDAELARLEGILLSRGLTASDKARALEAMFVRYETIYPNTYPSTNEAREAIYERLDPSIQNAFEALWMPTGYYLSPTSNGRWEGAKGDSMWIPDDAFRPTNKHYNNLGNLSWAEIKRKYRFEGLRFVRGKAQFGAIAHQTVCVDSFAELVRVDRADNREHLHNEAFRLLASKIGKPIEEVIRWKETENLVWHEDTDCKTLMIVPRELHDNIPHFGGIAMLGILRSSGLFEG